MSENEEIMNETENETMAAEVEAVETVETDAAEVEAADEVSAEEELSLIHILIIGWTSAKKFGLKPVMGMALGGILV